MATPPFLAISRSEPQRQDYGSVVHVRLGARGYDIRVGAGVMGRLGEWVRAVAPAKAAALISDSNAAALWGDAAAASLEAAGYRTARIVFPAGESSKSLAQAGKLFDELFQHPLDRNSPFVALGGGVTGDLAGFVAGTFKRGVPFIQVPTTLLAQVDAGVGGKTGVNHAAGKNLIGVVHQPSLVVSDVEALRRLPAPEFASGMAEVVKHALIADADLFAWLERHADDLVARKSADWAARMTELVAWNCAIKAGVVESDETETGPRAVLNYGHTIGHALEAVCGYGALLHGHAVAIGMMAEAEIALARGYVKRDLLDRQARLMQRLQLPTAVPAADQAALLAAVRQDKKSRDGTVKFVLPVGLGRVAFLSDVTEAEIVRVLQPK